jgi:hypothetical protein
MSDRPNDVSAVTATDLGKTEKSATPNQQLEPEPSRDAMGGAARYTPADAFGLLRSYSRHISFVRLGLAHVAQALERRGLEHDTSKMLDDEFAGFARINAAARINKFGSPEYSESMARERAVIDLHFSRNTHHPERPTLLHRDEPDDARYAAGMYEDAMTFLDVIEMVCDWWGARRGYDDPRPWEESVKLNLAAKGKYLSPEQLWLARSVADFLAGAA